MNHLKCYQVLRLLRLFVPEEREEEVRQKVNFVEKSTNGKESEEVALKVTCVAN